MLCEYLTELPLSVKWIIADIHVDVKFGDRLIVVSASPRMANH